MTLEHAPDNRRAFFTSWTLTGTQGGQILAALVFIPVVALPDEIKYGIGWRIPFWLSAVVVIVGGAPGLDGKVGLLGSQSRGEASRHGWMTSAALTAFALPCCGRSAAT